MGKFEDKMSKLAKEFPSVTETEFYSSGSVIFDSVIGGGIPKGTFVEISSPSGLGKSTAVLNFCKAVAQMGKKAVYLDHEQGVNQSQIDGIGLRPFLDKNFYLFQPITFEDSEKIIDQLAGEEELAYIVIDSITAMLPERMQSKSIGDIEPGVHARWASNFLLKYKPFARKNGVTFIFINQVRTKFNFRGISRNESAGGNAQKFYMDVRLELSLHKKLEKVTDTLEGRQSVPYGAHVNVWSVKNRYEKPFIPVVATIFYGKGISNLSAYHRWLDSKGIITQGGGGWYSIEFKGKKDKVRGERGLLTWVKENSKEIREYIEEQGGFLLSTDIDDE